MEQVAQIKSRLFGETALKKDKFHLQKISSSMEQSQPTFIIPSQLGKHASPLP